MSDWIKVGTIGVDAGLCWVGDPCYVMHRAEPPKAIGKDWTEFCGKLKDEVTTFDYDLGHAGLGVAVSTGYGDGVYPVYIKRNAEGRVACVMVRFCR